MDSKELTKVLLERDLSLTNSVTVDGPWGDPASNNQQFPIYVIRNGEKRTIGVATVKIGGFANFEIEVPDHMLPENGVGTFVVPMLFHVRKK